MSDVRSALGRFIVFGIVAGAVVLGVVVVRRVVQYPQTDDAIVMADIIGVVPQVSGTITELHVADNQAVKQGDLLFVIDPRPYEFAVQRARAEMAALDGEIEVTQRHIDGQRFAVAAAQGGGAAHGGAGEERHRQPPPARAAAAEGVRDTARRSTRRARRSSPPRRGSTRRDERWTRRRRTSAISTRCSPSGTRRRRRSARRSWTSSFCSVRAQFDALVVNLHTAIGQFVAPGPRRCSHSWIRGRGTSWRTIARPSSSTSRPGWRRRCTC